MKRSKYIELIDENAKAFGLSEALKFDLKRLGTAYMQNLITKEYHMELDNLLNSIGIQFDHVPTGYGDFVLRLQTRITK